MKVVCLALLLAVACPAHGAQLSPITRVVELLQGLSKTAEKQGEQEESLYEKFVCWGKTVISTKTATNAAAEARIQELETYIADIAAGRIEFTSERVDLEKDLEELNGAIEQATDMRKKENEEFKEAEDEMVKAVTALDAAITVLKEATAGHEKGTLLAQRTLSGEGFSRRMEESQSLARAVELGSKVLTKGDSTFLRRLLTGDVPKADWKKLNRKATFKSSYKARSFKIQDVLLKLNQTFTMNLNDARAKESEAQELFDKLMVSKNAEKSAAEEALAKLEAENGVRGMTKEESQAEVDALKEQVTNDSKFIEQTQKSLDEKKAEWKVRQELRTGEIAAISKAIAILSNDDAKDLFKKSFTSQGYTLLQEQTSTRSGKISEAMSALKRLMASSSDRRLAAIVSLATTGNFDKVIEAIDSMISTLHAEESTDLAEKEQCEKDMMEDTRKSVVTSRTMDELTDAMTKLKEEIEEILKEIEEKEATIKETEEQLAAATKQRQAENKDWMITDADDKEAVETVKQAKEVLSQFYAENNLVLVQKKQTPVVVAGDAPPPPPSTWEAPYGGKTEESTGIIAALEMISEDITQDLTDAKAAEDKSQAEYETFKAESEELIESLNADISTLNGVKADKEQEISEKTEERNGLSDELDAVMKKIADAKPGCDFIAINFGLRLQNRQVEIDGLEQAKAILLGAVFPTTPDPSREIKPGDALIQRHLRR